MANREKHITTKNLTVCESFDDFSELLENVDFTVEDVVVYITSLSNVYYWNSVESVWGTIGFTWDYQEYLSDEEALEYPNPQYRLQQVDPDGDNIEMDEQWLIEHKTKKGYGHFNTTTIPFSHIPYIPDGHRITAIIGATLASINSDIKTIYIDKSNWCNLNDVSRICSSERTIYADLDGSHITVANPLVGATGGGRLYIKADLSNCRNISLFGGDNMTKSMLVGNNYYKNLNITIGSDSSQTASIQNNNNYTDFNRDCSIVWEGTDPFKLEHFFTFSDYNNVYVNQGYSNIWSANGKYIISNYKNVSEQNGMFLKLQNLKDIVDEDTVIDLTIDCTTGVSDVRIDYDFSFRANKMYINNSYIIPRMTPIKYKGDVTSIGIYNPYLVIENDEWPELNQSLINKLNPDLGQQLFKEINIVNATAKCPYTIDARNLTYIDLFKYGIMTFSESFEKSYGRYYDFCPTIIVDENKVYDRVTFNWGNRGNTANYIFPIKKVKVVELFDCNEWRTMLYDEDTDITVNRITGSSSYSYRTVYDSTKPIITLMKLADSVKLRSNIQFTGTIVGNYYNIYNIQATDTELIDGDIINTAVYVKDAEVRHPFVLVNTNLDSSEALSCHYTNFRLIYRSHISQNQQFALSYNGYTDAELTAFANSFVETGNNIEYQITVKSYIYSALERLNLIGVITSKGYNVVNQL